MLHGDQHDNLVTSSLGFVPREDGPIPKKTFVEPRHAVDLVVSFP